MKQLAIHILHLITHAIMRVCVIVWETAKALREKARHRNDTPGKDI